MRKQVLLTAVSALTASAFAQISMQPDIIEDAIAYSVSDNARYIVSSGYTGIKIFDTVSGSSFNYTEESEDGYYTTGISRVVSDNGIVIGYESDNIPEYWSEGEWRVIALPSDLSGSCLLNSITPDGSRICGSVGLSGLSYDDDTLRQTPCIWNWNESEGTFDSPVILPHPDKDFSGRIPQLVTAIDISSDGKTIVGQVVTAVGTVRYPIVYTQDEAGVWSYRIPDYNVLYPEGVTPPTYPGDLGIPAPTEEEYMTSEEKFAYLEAYEEWIKSGYTLPFPDHKDFMAEEEYKAFTTAREEYEKIATEWAEKFDAYVEYFYTIASHIPDYQFNSIRVSPDGKTYANTIVVSDDDPLASVSQDKYFIWVFDLESGKTEKYEQYDDFILSSVIDGGKALASIRKGIAPRSFILSDGSTTGMYEWISSRNASYGTWMKENLGFETYDYVVDEATGDVTLEYTEIVLSGRVCATPDMTTVVLGIENVWDSLDDGMTCVFDMSRSDGVGIVNNTETESPIYDINGRMVRKSEASGIFIEDGKKKIKR